MPCAITLLFTFVGGGCVAAYRCEEKEGMAEEKGAMPPKELDIRVYEYKQTGCGTVWHDPKFGLTINGQPALVTELTDVMDLKRKVDVERCTVVFDSGQWHTMAKDTFWMSWT